MTVEGAIKSDVKLPEEELGRQIEDGFNDGKEIIVTVTAAMNEEQVRGTFRRFSRALTKVTCLVKVTSFKIAADGN